MPAEIVYARTDLIPSFYKCLECVANERIYLATVQPPPLEEVFAYQENLIKKNAPVFYALEGGRVVGWCDVLPINDPYQSHRGGLGMGLLPQFRGLGLGSKLLEAVLKHAELSGLEKVELHVYSTNLPAINLYKKFGFNQEGVIKKYRKLDGTYIDSLVMGKFLRVQDSISMGVHSAVEKSEPRIVTERIMLRLPKIQDIDSILRFFRENEKRFALTDPPRPPEFYTEEFWRHQIIQGRVNFHEGRELKLLFFESSGIGRVLGRINFTQMVRGPFQACNLGYAIDSVSEGQGLMAEAAQAAIEYVFNHLGFHRIMANHLPDNDRSAKLLRRLGFVVEGRAQNYLYINGEWREHILNALTNPHWKSEGHSF